MSGPADRQFQQDIKDSLKLVPEGVEGQVAYKGSASTVLHEKAEFVRITGAGLRESHVHDVLITRESPNYPTRV